MGFSESIATCMGKYATFTGRATRSEFWWFYLFTVLMNWGAIIVGDLSDNDELGNIFPGIVSLVFMLPSIAVGARRLHDIGKSGWWQLLQVTLIGIPVVIYWYAKDTNQELVNSES